MERLQTGINYITSSYKRSAAALFIFAALLSIPFTLSFLSQNQDIRQRASAVCSNVPADIMLVIDKSLSMNDRTSLTDQTTLLQKAKIAANQFIDTTAQSSQNKDGLVSFSSESTTTVNSQLTNNFASVKTQVNSIAATGETCTQCGIRKANEQITAAKRNGIKNVVVLLTDGRANAKIGTTGIGNEAEAELAAVTEAKMGNTANGTVFFTIGLGNKVNTAFLQKIATDTGGKYFFAPSANDLTSIYQQISQIVGKGSISGSVYNDTNSNGTFEATDTGLAGLTVTLNLAGQTTPMTATTDATGGFSFTGLCDGNYTLSEDLNTNWTVTTPSNNSYNRVIINGNVFSGNNFGNKPAGGATATPASSPSATLTPTSTPTNVPTDPQSTDTSITLALSLTGIGASTSAGINNNPQRPQRTTQIQVFNAQNQMVASKTATLSFDSATGTYKGTVGLGNNFSSGAYLVKARMDNTLWKTLGGIINITSGTTNPTPLTSLTSGDINHDNAINLLDYNLFISCFKNRNSCQGNELN